MRYQTDKASCFSEIRHAPGFRYCLEACGCHACNWNKWTLSVFLHLVCKAGRGVWAAVPAGIRGRERAASSLCLLSNKFIALPRVKSPRYLRYAISRRGKWAKKKNLLALCIVAVYGGHLLLVEVGPVLVTHRLLWSWTLVCASVSLRLVQSSHFFFFFFCLSDSFSPDFGCRVFKLPTLCCRRDGCLIAVS